MEGFLHKEKICDNFSQDSSTSMEWTEVHKVLTFDWHSFERVITGSVEEMNNKFLENDKKLLENDDELESNNKFTYSVSTVFLLN